MAVAFLLPKGLFSSVSFYISSFHNFEILLFTFIYTLIDGKVNKIFFTRIVYLFLFYGIIECKHQTFKGNYYEYVQC